jgi:8-oxo-dGTP diphosphatase
MVTRKRKISGEEQAFLDAYDPTVFERVSVAVDVALLTAKAGTLEVLLVERSEHPFKGAHQIPGGFVRPKESLDDATRRVLEEKVGVSGVFFEQLYTFGEPDRDPRTRVITVAHYALIPPERSVPRNGDTMLAKIGVPWEGETGGPVRVTDPNGKRLQLAFDHAEILGLCVKRLRGKLHYAPIGFQLLPKKFTLRQLQDVHETVLGRSLNKDSFRRSMLASGQLTRTGEIEASVGHRPAELYRFTKRSAV